MHSACRLPITTCSKPSEIWCRDIGHGSEIAIYNSVRANHLNRIERKTTVLMLRRQRPTPEVEWLDCKTSRRRI